jgi:hypothetical protein
MMPGKERQAWKSLTRFPHPQTNDDYQTFEIPVRFAGEP